MEEIRAKQTELLEESDLFLSLVTLHKAKTNGFVNLFCVYAKGFGKLGNEVIYLRSDATAYILNIPQFHRKSDGVLLLKINGIKTTRGKRDGRNIKLIHIRFETVAHIGKQVCSSLVEVILKGKLYKLQLEHADTINSQGWFGFVYKDTSPFNRCNFLLAVDMFTREKIANGDETHG